MSILTGLFSNKSLQSQAFKMVGGLFKQTGATAIVLTFPEGAEEPVADVIKSPGQWVDAQELAYLRDCQQKLIEHEQSNG